MATSQVDEEWFQRAWPKKTPEQKLEAYTNYLWGYLSPHGTSWKRGVSKILVTPEKFGVKVPGGSVEAYLKILIGDKRSHFSKWNLGQVLASEQYQKLLEAQKG